MDKLSQEMNERRAHREQKRLAFEKKRQEAKQIQFEKMQHEAKLKMQQDKEQEEARIAQEKEAEHARQKAEQAQQLAQEKEAERARHEAKQAQLAQEKEAERARLEQEKEAHRQIDANDKLRKPAAGDDDDLNKEEKKLFWARQAAATAGSKRHKLSDDESGAGSAAFSRSSSESFASVESPTAKALAPTTGKQNVEHGIAFPAEFPTLMDWIEHLQNLQQPGRKHTNAFHTPSPKHGGSSHPSLSPQPVVAPAGPVVTHRPSASGAAAMRDRLKEKVEQEQQQQGLTPGLDGSKMNSVTHKPQWDSLSNLCKLNGDGKPKVDAETYAMWTGGGACLIFCQYSFY